MNLDNERKAFEDEFRKINSNIVFWLNTWDEEMQGYNHPTMCWIWNMWLASANREGYKLVPVEASDHMKCVVRDLGPDIEDYENMGKHKWEVLCGDIYKAMIGACDD